MSRRDLSLGTIFRMPLALTLLSLTGLVGALLADGVWDMIGTGLLVTSFGAIFWARRGHRT
ncbi:MAG: hypothetical protein KKG14_12030 [Alphaproteobacteria bacterium]|nr:hypothetical protein [Alphaproteobacteria bacterium]MBU2271387.1 hypothetical protein [Alphaproteobacteria bacterium]MBU2419420.1 hypothetical protein [Alphaproteobacteria bacterium]